MRKILFIAPAMMLAVGLLTACASQGNSADLPLGLENSLDSRQLGADVIPSQMETEAQLREGLAPLQDKSDTQAAQLLFYEELLARDLCREEDYLAMAQLYADIGDVAAQRCMLRWLFHLYPSEEYAQQLQELVVQRSMDEASAAALIAALQQALIKQDAVSLRDVIKREDWREIFQEEPEIYATHTRYSAENLTAQIVSDGFETEVFLFAADGVCLYGRLNDVGSVIASAIYADDAYNGNAEVCWFDAEGVLYKKYQTVLRNDVCVDSISVEYEGVSYRGALGEDGSTMEQQQEKVTQTGGVVYAYQEGGTRYLYQNNSTKETFRMDCSAMGLPRVDIWK